MVINSSDVKLLRAVRGAVNEALPSSFSQTLPVIMARLYNNNSHSAVPAPASQQPSIAPVVRSSGNRPGV